jgi:hypothetical protein
MLDVISCISLCKKLLYQHMPYCQLSHALNVLMYHDSVLLRLPQIMVSADRIRGKDKIIRKAKDFLSKREKLCIQNNGCNF